MNKKVTWSIKIILLLAMVGAGWLLYPSLPEKFPTHWNYQGQIDGYSTKDFGVWLIPGITLLMMLLFPLFRKMDPKSKRFLEFEKPWEMVQLGLIVYMAYIYFVMLYIIFHPAVSMNPFMMAGIGVLFILIGNYLGKVRQNYTIGIRVPWTIDNEEVWNRTHRLGGWCFVISGMVFLLNAYFNWQTIWVFVGALLLAAVVPIVYSYVIFRQITKKT